MRLPKIEQPRMRIGRIPVRRRWEVIVGYRDQLVAHARRVGAAGEAEDIAHDALVKAYLTATLEETRLEPHLHRIVEDLTRGRLRDAGRERAPKRRTPAGWSPRSIEDDAVARDLARRAVTRLRRTEPPATLAILVRRADGYTWSEIAAELGLTATAAQTQLRRSLFRVRYWLHRQATGA